MKRILTMISLLVAISAWGQSNQKIIITDKGRYREQFLTATHPEFSYQGKISLFVYESIYPYSDNAEEQSTNITFYDEDFNPGKSIQIPVKTTTIYLEKKERENVGNVTLSFSYNGEHIYDYDTNVSSFTVETAKSYLSQRGVEIESQETKEDGTYFYVEFYKDEIYGKIYPTKFYCLASDGSFFAKYCEYEESASYTGAWVDGEREVYHKDYVVTFVPMSFFNYDVCGYDGHPIYISQTLFNDDEKFEYIIPFADESISKVEGYDRDGDGNIDSYAKYYGYPSAGFNVMSEDGTILQTIKYDGDFVANSDWSYDYISVIKINGKIYIEVEGCVIDENENECTTKSATLIFALDKETNSVKKIAKHIGMNVRPTIADRYEPITIELDDDAVNEITVTNAAGQTVKRIPVNAGQRQVTFSSQGLSKGLNVINARGKNGNNNCKIIVK